MELWRNVEKQQRRHQLNIIIRIVFHLSRSRIHLLLHEIICKGVETKLPFCFGGGFEKSQGRLGGKKLPLPPPVETGQDGRRFDGDFHFV